MSERRADGSDGGRGPSRRRERDNDADADGRRERLCYKTPSAQTETDTESEDTQTQKGGGREETDRHSERSTEVDRGRTVATAAAAAAAAWVATDVTPAAPAPPKRDLVGVHLLQPLLLLRREVCSPAARRPGPCPGPVSECRSNG